MASSSQFLPEAFSFALIRHYSDNVGGHLTGCFLDHADYSASSRIWHQVMVLSRHTSLRGRNRQGRPREPKDIKIEWIWAVLSVIQG